MEDELKAAKQWMTLSNGGEKQALVHPFYLANSKVVSATNLTQKHWNWTLKVTVKARGLCYNKSSPEKTTEPIDIKQIEDEFKMNYH